MGDIAIATPFTNGETGIDHTRLNSAINDSTINTNAVTTAKINDLAVTGAKLAASSATPSKLAIKSIVGHRLTLESNVPVSTSDQLAKTTLYFTPHIHNEIALYTGSEWRLYEVDQISIAIPATTNTNYDVWCHYNSGTPALELLAWTNATTRATALTRQNGVYVKTGDATRRYVGTIRTTAVSGQCEDSAKLRLVANYYNSVLRSLRATEGTNSWAYTIATWREANGGSTLGTTRVGLVLPIGNELVLAQAHGLVSSTAASIKLATGVGIDSTSVNSAQIFGSGVGTGSVFANPTGRYKGHPGVGYHVLSWLEISAASGVSTWYGDDGGTLVQTGLTVEVHL